jgi:DNA-binding Lrp family transcriptional regulator
MADAQGGEGHGNGHRHRQQSGPRQHRRRPGGLRSERGQDQDARTCPSIASIAARSTSCRRRAGFPTTRSAHIVSGDADFLLEVVVPDLRSYERFLLGSLLKLPGVKDVRTNFAIRTVKAPSPLPLGHLA